MEELALVAGSRLAWPDIVVMCAYFLSVLAVGVWSSRRGQSGSMSGYFLASRNMHWIPVGASLFASNIGSGHFIGLAGAGAASGVAAHGYEQAAIYGLLLLGWLFVPVYMSAGVYTMPQYLKMRFGGQRIRILLSCLSLALYIFTKIAADLYAGALFIQQAMNQTSQTWLYLSVALLLAVAAVFTIAGGLTTVVYTDLLQTILMVAGALILAAMSFQAVGGYSSLVESYPYATATVRAMDAHQRPCGEPSRYYMNLLRPINPTLSDYPWLGMTFGMSILQVWYWCTDQVIVQRTLASKSIVHAKGGTILAAYLKFLPLWVMVLPGMAARVLYPERVACASSEGCLAACGSTRGCTNSAYVELVLNILPAGLRGMMLAVMIAALMSSLTSVFNSASTICTVDIWHLVRTQGPGKNWGRGPPSELEMIVVGRVSVLLLVVASVIWIPVIQNSGNAQLFDYINTIVSILCSPICAIYLLALFCPRANEKGAFWGLMTGMVMGIIRFVAEFYYTIPPCGSDEPDLRPSFIKRAVGDVHYLHFSLLCWMVTMTVAASVSLITEPISPQRLYRLTFWSRRDPRVRQAKHTQSATHHHHKDVENAEDATKPSPSTLDSQTHTSQWWRRMVEAVCGAAGGSGAECDIATPCLSEEEKAQHAADFLQEPPFWRKFVNINAVICLTLSTFVYGFYA